MVKPCQRKGWTATIITKIINKSIIKGGAGGEVNHDHARSITNEDGHESVHELSSLGTMCLDLCAWKIPVFYRP